MAWRASSFDRSGVEELPGGGFGATTRDGVEVRLRRGYLLQSSMTLVDCLGVGGDVWDSMASLLGVSVAVLGAGLVTGLVGVREGLMLAAPAIQFAVYRPLVRRGLSSRDCIGLTHLGSALLVFFIIGNAIWLALGLPENIYL